MRLLLQEYVWYSCRISVVSTHTEMHRFSINSSRYYRLPVSRGFVLVADVINCVSWEALKLKYTYKDFSLLQTSYVIRIVFSRKIIEIFEILREESWVRIYWRCWKMCMNLIVKKYIHVVLVWVFFFDISAFNCSWLLTGA